jgi:cytochrome c551/c552
MDILKDIALSPSIDHYQLIVCIAALSAVVLVPYLAFALGSAILAMRYEAKGKREKDAAVLEAAYDSLHVPFANKHVMVFLGLLPALILVLAQAQMLKSTSALSVDLSAAGFVLIAAGLILLAFYTYTFRLQDVLASYRSMLGAQKGSEEKTKAIGIYEKSNSAAHQRAGSWGIAALALGAFLFSAAEAVTADPSQWQSIESIVDVFLNPGVWIKFFVFCSIVPGMTALGLSFFFSLEKEKTYKNLYTAEIIRRLVRWSAASLIVLPIVLLANIAAVPPAAVSGMLYSLAGLALVLFFAAAHFVYGFYRTGERQAASLAFFLFLFAVGVTVAGEYTGIGTATRAQAAALSVSYEKEMETLEAKYGTAEVSFTGEDIYNARCSACHLFDQKKVGPPYFETVPKYNKNKSQLAAFILNPQKKNPDYPSMPNQGLRQDEADSIAAYLILKVAQAGR